MKTPTVLMALVFAFGAVTASSAVATTYHILPDGSGDAPTIQAGLNSCTAGDTVLVAAGTYFENLVWPSMDSVVLVSEFGPEVTTIDGGGSGRVIEIGGADATTIIDGFTIQNGGLGGGYGAGILCRDYSSPTIIHNTITGNHNGSESGGIGCYNNSSPTIADNWISGNTAMCGAGIGCRLASSPTVTGNLITGNTADYFGGGIGWIADCSPTVTGNTIQNNEAVAGAGIYIHIGSGGDISGNIICENVATEAGGGIYSGYGSKGCVPTRSITISGNTINDNSCSFGGAGIHCDDSAVATVTECNITHNYGDGIQCESGGSLSVTYSNITENTDYGVRNLNSGDVIIATNNWWGDASGPGGVGPGVGDEVSSDVIYDPWSENVSAENLTWSAVKALYR